MILHFGTSTSKYQSGEYKRSNLSSHCIVLILSLCITGVLYLVVQIIKGIFRLVKNKIHKNKYGPKKERPV